jgi:enediyne biosynthesis protein E4
MIRRRWMVSFVALASAAAIAAQGHPPTVAVPPPSPNAAHGVTYVDATVASGIGGFRHVSGEPAKDYIIEVTGSGVAFFDADNDGRLDVYLVNGSTLDLVRERRPAPRAAFFRNDGDRTFTDMTVTSGLANERWGQGVCVGDFDNDGFEDVYVTNFGPNRLYRNLGGRGFADIAGKAGLALDSWTTGCAFGDYDGDGLLDLFVAGYVALDLANLPPSPSHPAPV